MPAQYSDIFTDPGASEAIRLQEDRDAALDEALIESFPASDPIAIHIDGAVSSSPRRSAKERVVGAAHGDPLIAGRLHYQVTRHKSSREALKR